MNKKLNILVFPCGAENAIEVFYALKDVVNLELFGATSRSDHGEYVFKNLIEGVPYIQEENFIEVFNDLVNRYNIDVVIPTHDDVVLKLAECQKAINAKILVHGLDQARITRSKKNTYHLFKDFDFCPIVFSNLDEIDNLPVFAKPDFGQGSKGAFKVIEKRELELIEARDYVFTEYLPGEEFTVDCFTDRTGKLRFVGPRRRDRVANGISMRSSTVPLSEEIERIALCISQRLGLNGLWYFQLKKNTESKLKLLEVSLRVSGTMNLYRSLGVNFPLLAIYDVLGYEVTILSNEFNLQVDRALINRYKHNLDFNTIYVDFDDTITSNGDVNSDVIGFLYNVRSRKKKIILLTKHQNDIYITLNDLRIHKKLFDSIVVVGSHEKKSSYIVPDSQSIFIDNSFVERLDVWTNCRIPVFDVDAIPVLLDIRK